MKTFFESKTQIIGKQPSSKEILYSDSKPEQHPYLLPALKKNLVVKSKSLSTINDQTMPHIGS